MNQTIKVTSLIAATLLLTTTFGHAQQFLHNSPLYNNPQSMFPRASCYLYCKYSRILPPNDWRLQLLRSIIWNNGMPITWSDVLFPNPTVFAFWRNPNWWQPYARNLQWYRNPQTNEIYYGSPNYYETFFISGSGTVSTNPTDVVVTPIVLLSNLFHIVTAWYGNAIWDELNSRYVPLFDPMLWQAFAPSYRMMLEKGAPYAQFYFPSNPIHDWVLRYKGIGYSSLPHEYWGKVTAFR